MNKDSTQADHSASQPRYTSLSNVRVWHIRVAPIVQKMVHLGLPLDSRYRRFIQFVANSAYFTCLLGAFIRLWQSGADFTILVLLASSSSLLSITCLYYACIWEPKQQDTSNPSPEPSDFSEQTIAQQTKHQLRRGTQVLALVGLFAIPLLTFGGFVIWQSLPPSQILLLVANLTDAPKVDHQVTDNIIHSLRIATKPYKSVKVQALNRPISEQQSIKFLRAVGKQRKASLVIFGDHSASSPHAKVSVHFEVLKPLTYLSNFKQTTEGYSQELATVELNSFKVQVNTPEEITYLTLFKLGMIQYEKKNWNAAITYFSDTLTRMKEPVTVLNWDTVYSHRGASYDQQGKYTQAIDDYTQAIDFNPNKMSTHIKRGQAYYKQNQYRHAISDFSIAIIYQPNNALAHFYRGNVFYNLGDDIQAISDFTQAIKLDPGFASAYIERGHAYYKRGNYDQAMADLNRAIQLQPSSALAYIDRGDIYYNQGKNFRALIDYSLAIQFEPNKASLYIKRGAVHYKLGNYNRAIVDYTKVIQLQPNSASAHYNKACIYSLKRNLQKTIENLQRAIQLDSKYREKAKVDSDFDNFRKEKQFEALVRD